jgi:hypothetical protein
MIRNRQIEGVLQSFPMWAGFLVKGEPVTELQRAEILFRTSDFETWCNDTDWVETIQNHLYTRRPERNRRYQRQPPWDVYETEFHERYQILDLKVLHNYRIMSPCWEGSRGWCGWDGTVGCNSYNLDRVSAGDLMADWILIAKTFPYLKLRSQILNKPVELAHKCRPLVEFVVADGKVDIREPEGLSCDTNPPKDLRDRTERCCSPAQLQLDIQVSDTQPDLAEET